MNQIFDSRQFEIDHLKGILDDYPITNKLWTFNIDHFTSDLANWKRNTDLGSLTDAWRRQFDNRKWKLDSDGNRYIINTTVSGFEITFILYSSGL